MIRVLLADDQLLVREGLASLISDEDGITVVGAASTGAEAIDQALVTRPDVILMDIRMPGLDGVEATRRITADGRLASVKVIMLTTFDLEQYVFGAIRAGASGFLLKDTDPSQLLEAIRIVVAGDALVAPSVTRQLIERLAVQPDLTVPAKDLAALTERELEILAEVGHGLSNSQIAERLIISHNTVKTHVSRILTKLGAHDRAQLVVTAYETGLIVPGSARSAEGPTK